MYQVYEGSFRHFLPLILVSHDRSGGNECILRGEFPVITECFKEFFPGSWVPPGHHKPTERIREKQGNTASSALTPPPPSMSNMVLGLKKIDTLMPSLYCEAVELDTGFSPVWQ